MTGVELVDWVFAGAGLVVVGGYLMWAIKDSRKSRKEAGDGIEVS